MNNDTKLNIWVSDVRSMLDGDNETKIVKCILRDKVLSLDEVMDCFDTSEISEWLEDNAEYYNFTKQKEE